MTDVMHPLAISAATAIEPDFRGEMWRKLDGKNRTALVLCHAPMEPQWEIETVGDDLAKLVAYHLNEGETQIFDPDRVHAWLARNRDRLNPVEVGAEFDADYVVQIDLMDFSLFEEHSDDLYRGRADAIVRVVKMNDDKKGGTEIYSKGIVYRFPASGPVSAYQQAYFQFKEKYLSTLAAEVGSVLHESLLNE